MAVIKKIKDNAFSASVSIVGGGGTQVSVFAFDSTSDGGVADIVVGGKTSCPTI